MEYGVTSSVMVSAHLGAYVDLAVSVFLGGFPSTMTSTYGLGLSRAALAPPPDARRAESRVSASCENEEGRGGREDEEEEVEAAAAAFGAADADCGAPAALISILIHNRGMRVRRQKWEKNHHDMALKQHVLT